MAAGRIRQAVLTTRLYPIDPDWHCLLPGIASQFDLADLGRLFAGREVVLEGATDQRSEGREVFMHWDMEGASGLFTREQTWFWEPGVRAEVAAEGRRLLTADVESACAAALAAGAEAVIVCDTHHGGGNLDLEQMTVDPAHHLPRAQHRAPGRTAPLDAGARPERRRADAAGSPRQGGDAERLPAARLVAGLGRFRINGQSVGEIGIESCFAGHWDVPLILAQGDEAACAEAEEQFPAS